MLWVVWAWHVRRLSYTHMPRLGGTRHGPLSCRQTLTLAALFYDHEKLRFFRLRRVELALRPREAVFLPRATGRAGRRHTNECLPSKPSFSWAVYVFPIKQNGGFLVRTDQEDKRMGTVFCYYNTSLGIVYTWCKLFGSLSE